MSEKIDGSMIIADYINHINQQGYNFKILTIIFFLIMSLIIGVEVCNLFHFPQYIFGFLISSIGFMLSFSIGNTLCFKYCHYKLVNELINSIDEESITKIHEP